jgi:hypothetical protein
MFASLYSVSESKNVLPKKNKCINKLNLDADFTENIVNMLKSKLSKINEFTKKNDELNDELDCEIKSLINGYDFNRDPMDYKHHPTISQHHIFKKACKRYEKELDYISYYIAMSSKYRYTGNFFSTVWNNCKLPDDNEKNIRAIVVYDEDTEEELVIKNPLNITEFMESYILPPYYKPSVFSKLMKFNNNSWPLVITIYTDKYIYEGESYDEDYVIDQNVTLPFTQLENKEDLGYTSGYRQHFMFFKRNFDDLKDSSCYF